MRKGLFAAAALLPALLNAGGPAQPISPQQPNANAKQKKTTSYIFSVPAKRVLVKKAGKSLYKLRFFLTPQKHVLMESDRPQRITKYISIKQLSEIWSLGNNSFKEDNPNALLSSLSMNPISVIVKQLTVQKNNQAVFTVYTNQAISKPSLNKVVLTIDGDSLSGCVLSCGWSRVENAFRIYGHVNYTTGSCVRCCKQRQGMAQYCNFD